MSPAHVDELRHAIGTTTVHAASTRSGIGSDSTTAAPAHVG
jgi:hypothetical protein